MPLESSKPFNVKYQTGALHIVDSNSTELLVRCNYDFAVCHHQPPDDNNSENVFNNLIEIPPQIYCPKAQDWFIRAPKNIPERGFVKYPRLTLSADNPKTRFLREVLVCETMVELPHPNVARYHGLIIKNDLVRGICYERYSATLNEKVNPYDLPKAEFRYSSKYPLKDKVAFLAGIRAGVAHLHALDLIHNDLKPSNIMLKDNEDETPVIVDFDSCALVGTPSAEVGRSLGWHEPGEEGVRASDDDKAVDEIEKWLSDEPVTTKGYAFEVEEVLMAGERQAMETRRVETVREERLLAVNMERNERDTGEGDAGKGKEVIAKKSMGKGRKQKKRRKGKKMTAKIPVASSVSTASA